MKAMRGETRAGDPVHMAASGREHPLVNRAPRLITRACWIFWGVVLASVLIGIAGAEPTCAGH
jgi:hypothetical protein